MLNHDLVLKSDELFLVGAGDGRGEGASGLYGRDTRYLDRCAVRLNDVPLRTLSTRLLGPASAIVVDANGAFPVPGPGGADDVVLPLSVSVEQHIQLGAALEIRFVVRNFSGRSLPLTLSLDLSADFRDLFEIRGFPRSTRAGNYSISATRPNAIVFTYVNRTGVSTMMVVGFSQDAATTDTRPGRRADDGEPEALLPGLDEPVGHASLPLPPSATVSFATPLAGGATRELTMTITPVPTAGGPFSVATGPPEREAPRTATVTTDHPGFNRVLGRAAADLAMLQTSFPEGALPAAGIPWFVAPFGRDSLIVGLQTLHLAPARAAATLRVLASMQGERIDPFREEEPGKILHEVRYGEMARLAEIPHTPYYGSVDATPLFILLFAETVAWTGDEALYAGLLPNIERALTWIEQCGDRDGDGLVEYRTGTADGVRIVHQGWKDSHDSLHHPDGRPAATGEIALIEVQGYVFAAYRRLADVAATMGNPGWAAHLRNRAEAVRRTVEECFWLDALGFYAQALDGDKTPVATINSNAGHLLYTGLPTPERAAMVASRLRQPDLDSGWGIRTLSSTMPSYNPMSYHNGSVWPHDNSLIAAGLHSYGHADDANRIASALVAAAETDPLARLPELYCGFARAEEAARLAPVAYPVSCSPQAWAAAASQLLVRSMLGLRIDVAAGSLLVEPALPPWLNEVTIHDLEVLGQRCSLAVRRSGDAYAIASEGPMLLMAGRGTA
ncbi:MAG: amylo-alpha-1,6-glucosidase [Chloroflexota bacterium]|nr:amylo-alpha-1,6-glucosidase [Chloroflexota bacterium]